MTARARPTPAGQVTLSDIQAPVAASLARVGEEMWRIVAVDSALLNGVSEHLMLMKGKMLRPTLLLRIFCRIRVDQVEREAAEKKLAHEARAGPLAFARGFSDVASLDLSRQLRFTSHIGLGFEYP